jgi:hypothetical protein
MNLIAKVTPGLFARNVITGKPRVALNACDVAIPCTPLRTFTIVKPTVPGPR